MKKRLLVVLFLTASAMAQSWTNCSNATMTLTTINEGGCAPTTPPPYTKGLVAPIASSWTYQDTCTNSITSGSQYYSSQSKVTGNGQCWSKGYASGTGSTPFLGWYYCRGSNQSQVTLAQNANDYNRMYNRAYDNWFDGTSSSCTYSGIWRQNMQQCGPITCPTQLSGCCVNPTQCSYAGSGMQCNFTYCDCQSITPIIIDTTGKGFHFTSANGGVLFDFFGDSAPFQMAWTAADSGNGFLVLDRNHNGRIDNAKEMFGNITPDQAPYDPAIDPTEEPNGLRALRWFDLPEHGGNGDGIFDWRDAGWSQGVMVWRDDNHDGISQPGELHTLESMGVYSIGLKYHIEPFVDQFNNKLRYVAVLNPNPADGTSQDGRKLIDVEFVANPSKVKRAGCPQKKVEPLQPLAEKEPNFLKDILN